MNVNCKLIKAEFISRYSFQCWTLKLKTFLIMSSLSFWNISKVTWYLENIQSKSVWVTAKSAYLYVTWVKTYRNRTIQKVCYLIHLDVLHHRPSTALINTFKKLCDGTFCHYRSLCEKYERKQQLLQNLQKWKTFKLMETR